MYIYIHKVFRSENTLFKIFRHVAFVSLSFLVSFLFIYTYISAQPESSHLTLFPVILC